MVKYIEDIFLDNLNLWNTLDIVSDNCCPNFLFIYKSQNSRDRIHRHLNNKLTRYKFIFQNIFSMECDKFLNNWLKV